MTTKELAHHAAVAIEAALTEVNKAPGPNMALWPKTLRILNGGGEEAFDFVAALHWQAPSNKL